MAKYLRVRAESPPKPSFSDGDGNQIHNEILSKLPGDGCEALFSKLEFVRLKVHHLLHEPGDTLKSAYFCNSGMISVLTVFPDGKSVEVGVIGNEGFVGVPLIAGFRTASNRAITQVPVRSRTLVRSSMYRQNWSC